MRTSAEAGSGKREAGSPRSRSSARAFTELTAWQRAHEHALAVYRLTGSFPKHELFGLTSQYRRAAVSAPANIAEGFRKRGRSDKLRFFNIAQGSLDEAAYFAILTRDLGYGDPAHADALCREAIALLGAYVRAIHADSSRGP
jgi:four helix bundle protein